MKIEGRPDRLPSYFNLMKGLLLSILFCVIFTGVKAQYNIVADTSICLLQIQRQQGQIDYALELSEIRYTDINQNLFLLFDNVRTIQLDNLKIWNFATIAGIKTRVDQWAVQCTD